MTPVDQLSSLSEGEDVFRTQRLLVRAWRAADEAALLALYGDRDVVRWVDDGQPLSVNEAAQWMEVTRSNYQKRGYGMFAIEELHSAKTIGFGGLVHPQDQLDAEVKYAFAPAVWGQGFATEFVRSLVEYARTKHGLTRIIATVAAGNVASQRVLIKSGFRRSRTMTESDGSRILLFELQS